VALVELPFAFLASAEKGGVGDTCVLRGCVPKKLLLFATEFKAEIESSKGFGWVTKGQRIFGLGHRKCSVLSYQSSQQDLVHNMYVHACVTLLLGWRSGTHRAFECSCAS
jgi:glutathione reductase (NADPH)